MCRPWVDYSSKNSLSGMRDAAGGGAFFGGMAKEATRLISIPRGVRHLQRLHPQHPQQSQPNSESGVSHGQTRYQGWCKQRHGQRVHPEQQRHHGQRGFDWARLQHQRADRLLRAAGCRVGRDHAGHPDRDRRLGHWRLRRDRHHALPRPLQAGPAQRRDCQRQVRQRLSSGRDQHGARRSGD